MRLKLVPSETSWDFFRFSRVTFGFSVMLVVISLALEGLIGLNFGIDFTGGTTIRTDSTRQIDVGEYRRSLEALELGEVSVVEVDDVNFAADQNVATITIQAQEDQEAIQGDTIVAIQLALAAATESRVLLTPIAEGAPWQPGPELIPAGASWGEIDSTPGILLPPGTEPADLISLQQSLINARALDRLDTSYEFIDFTSIESIGPTVSGELIWTAILAVSLAIAAVLFYIWLRFEWQFSLGAVAALVHDVIVTVGVFSLLQIRFDLAIIAALLTIVGYSLNDTVVVFDRVRENLRKYKKKELKEVLNLSINETLSRTVMTSVTTLLALVSLYIFGGDVIRGFVFAMIWGVIVGTYSSVFVASNVLLMLGVKRDWSKPDANAGTQFSNIDA